MHPSRRSNDSNISHFNLDPEEMQPLLGGSRERSDGLISSEDSSMPPPPPTHCRPRSHNVEVQAQPSRTRSLSPSKRKIEDIMEVSNSKRRRSDSDCTTVKVPGDGYIPLRSDDGISERASDPSTNLDMLNKTNEALTTLLGQWQVANKLVAELSQVTESLGSITGAVLETTGRQQAEASSTDIVVPQAETPVPTLRSRRIAGELVRRLKSNYGFSEVLNPDMEREHTANLYYLLRLTEGSSALPDDATPAMWFIIPRLREERAKVYHALLAHPYITRKTASSTTEMQRQLKQDVVNFFDRCFTYQVAAVHRIDVSLTEHETLLRLGGDALFNSAEGLDTGGEIYWMLDANNQEAWQELVMETAELMDSENAVSPKRARGESSMGSLGLTRLYLSDDQDTDYDGGDESNVEPKMASSKHHRHMRDSGIDLQPVPPASQPYQELNYELEPDFEPDYELEPDFGTRLFDFEWDFAAPLLRRQRELYSETESQRERRFNSEIADLEPRVASYTGTDDFATSNPSDNGTDDSQSTEDSLKDLIKGYKQFVRGEEVTTMNWTLKGTDEQRNMSIETLEGLINSWKSEDEQSDCDKQLMEGGVPL